MKKKLIISIVCFVFIVFNSKQAKPDCEKDTLLLSKPKHSWGKPVKNSFGELTFCTESSKYFKGNIVLKKLKPNHNYILTFNSKRGGSGGKNLPERYGNEYKWDFLQLSTDSEGNCKKKIKRRLNIDNYDIKFFVKDTDDWQIVLYTDFLNFEIIK